jgi:two-component system, response regulator PdtaR
MIRASQPASILIVEDEVLVALDNAMILQDAGHEICGIARNQPEALQLARLHAPDVALVDINLADGETGLGLTRHLFGRHGVCCILTTAYTYPLDDREHAACARLAKPFSAGALREALDYCARRRGSGRRPQARPRGLEILPHRKVEAAPAR